MKRISFLLILAFIFSASRYAEAQRPVQRRNNYNATPPPPTQKKANNYGDPDTTIKGNTQPSSYGNTGNSGMSIDSTLPINVIQSSNNGLLDSTKMSLRNDGAVEKNLIRERIPLAYENIREDDAVFVVRVWREIDAREKMNLSF